MASVSKLVAFFIILIMMSLILLARFQSEDAKSAQIGRLIARGARKVTTFSSSSRLIFMGFSWSFCVLNLGGTLFLGNAGAWRNNGDGLCKGSADRAGSAPPPWLSFKTLKSFCNSDCFRIAFYGFSSYSLQCSSC
ncbi:hypothetical protein LINGRAHAP2_LOCUS21765 [Linum grandiflorum]